MNYKHLQTLLADSPIFKLLRAKHAPLILSVLHQEFKETNRLTIPHYALADALTDYLEGLRAAEPDANGGEDAAAKARQYLDAWCMDENNYLRKYTDDKGVDVYELTPHTEKALQWLQELDAKEFVGTESMFLDIFRKVKELVDNSHDDPARKLAALQKQKADIEAQIREIEASGVVKAFNDTQVKERFYEINRSAKQLLADFRQVEQNFRDLVRKIYEKHAEKESKKGEILGYVMDETDALQQSDQGRSFYTFWQVLMDRARREEFERAVEQLYYLLEYRQLDGSDGFLGNIKIYLLDAGKKVLDSNHLLVEKLHRILAGQSNQHRKRTRELVGDIKKYALKTLNAPPQADEFIEIDGSPCVQLPMERPLTDDAPQEIEFLFHPSEIGSDDLDDADFHRLLSQFEINKEALLHRISTRLSRKPQVSLREILDEHPLEDGLAELLTYFSIASQSPNHLIHDEQYELIPLQKGGMRMARVPQIIFTR